MEGLGKLLEGLASPLVSFAAICGTLWLIYRKAVRPVVQAMREMLVLFRAQLVPPGEETIVELVGQIGPLRAEVHENHKIAEGHWKAHEQGLADLWSEVAQNHEHMTTQLDRQRAISNALVHQLPEPQRSAVQAIVDTLGGGGG